MDTPIIEIILSISLSLLALILTQGTYIHTRSYLLKYPIFHFLTLGFLSPDPLACSRLRPSRPYPDLHVMNLRRQRSHRPLLLDASVVDPRRLRHCQCLSYLPFGSPPLLSGRPLCSCSDQHSYLEAQPGIAAKVVHDEPTAHRPTALPLGWLEMEVFPFRAELRRTSYLVQLGSDMPSVDA
jgi:hypothetical protein